MYAINNLLHLVIVKYGVLENTDVTREISLHISR